MKEAYIRIRLDETIKEEIRAQADKLGLTMSAYLVLLHRQNINKDK